MSSRSFDEQVPVAVSLLDLETGQQKKLFDVQGWRTRLALIDNQIVYAELGHIKFATLDGVMTKRDFFLDSAILRTAVSANRRWLAVIDFSKQLWLVTAGNHQDVAIFDRATLRLLFFTQSSAAAFYIEKVWVKGDRMIMTGDTGVMHSGTIK